jgi:hypothetical protein
MKIMLLMLVLVASSVTTVFAQPIINYPTNDQVLYVGEKVEIKWTPRQGAGSNVSIYLQSDENGVMDWINISTPNTGTYTWIVGKWNALTKFSLSIRDGGDYANTSTVHIVIPNGPRPPEPLPVPVQIRKVVSIEWLANTNHTYRLESSTNLINWSVEFEGISEHTNARALFYQEQPQKYFRVLNLTP